MEEFKAIKAEDENGDVQSGNNKDTLFDSVIGHVEDIILESSFQNMQNSFLEKHYFKFEDQEENKLEYMEIFNQYTEKLEKYIERELNNRVPGFQMDSFLSQLKLRESELEGEVFELLLSFSDFLSFKEMILDYKASKEGRYEDLSLNLTVTSMKS